KVQSCDREQPRGSVEPETAEHVDLIIDRGEDCRQSLGYVFCHHRAFVLPPRLPLHVWVQGPWRTPSSALRAGRVGEVGREPQPPLGSATRAGSCRESSMVGAGGGTIPGLFLHISAGDFHAAASRRSRTIGRRPSR